MNDFEYRKGQFKNSWPLHLVFTWAVIANIVDGMKLYQKTIPIGSTIAAERIVLILFVVFFIAAIHFKSSKPNDPIDHFLYKNLPAILLGFSISFFISFIFPIHIGFLIGFSGVLLYKERNET